MNVNEQDLEQLELYLDHELAGDDVRRLDERLTVEPTLAMTLASLRSQRSMRLSSMSTVFDTDAASIERLVASVRVAQASEAMQRRRFFAWAPPMRTMMAAAACVAFGLLLGITLQNRHAGASGVIASPSVTNTSTMFDTGFGTGNNTLQGHGQYVVSILGGDGQEVMKVRFYTQEQAQQFISRINNRAPDAPAVRVGDARILDEPF